MHTLTTFETASNEKKSIFWKKTTHTLHIIYSSIIRYNVYTQILQDKAYLFVLIKKLF